MLSAARRVNPTVSVIVPLRDEESTLVGTCKAVGAVLDRHVLPYELIFVDDGSTDSSAAVLSSLVRSDSRVTAIRLRRNFGKAAALATGFTAARGEWVVTLDADLQDDPEEIPILLGKLKEGYDLVSGWKQERRDPLSRRLASKFFNWVTCKVSGLRLHDINCGLKAYTRECAAALATSCYGEQHRYLPVIAHWRGFRVAEVPVNHRKRLCGSSRYGLERYVRGLLDLLTTVFLCRYARRPMHVFGSAGLVLLLIGSAMLLAVLLAKAVLAVSVDHLPLLVLPAGCLIAGLQLLLIGLVAEMLSRLPSLVATLGDTGPEFPTAPLIETRNAGAPRATPIEPLAAPPAQEITAVARP